MIVVDVNLLLYAVDVGSPDHAASRAWWAAALTGPEVVGLPWATTTGFIRLASNARIFAAPLSPSAAASVVRAWLELAHVVPVDPSSRHLSLLAGLLTAGAGPKTVPDAHLAALAIEHDATLVSADGDFARFPGLRWHNPLAPRPT